MNSGQIIKKYEVVFYNNPYAEIDNWEKFTNKTWETSENYDVDVDIFEGCPACAPYITIVSESIIILEKIKKTLLSYNSKFKVSVLE